MRMSQNAQPTSAAELLRDAEVQIDPRNINAGQLAVTQRCNRGHGTDCGGRSWSRNRGRRCRGARAAAAGQKGDAEAGVQPIL